jgi:thioredoxin
MREVILARRGSRARSMSQQAATNVPDSSIKDTTTQTFVKDVIEESKRQPVLVDFWAPWCGPCKQLTPVLEKAVKAAKGKVKLVKMNIDDHPAIPGQMGIQSIPAVIAFVGGQPADGFMGALPEGQVVAFLERLTKDRIGGEVGDLLKGADAAFAEQKSSHAQGTKGKRARETNVAKATESPTSSSDFVFVSHVTEDRAAAMQIVATLERRGIRCWIAPRNVRPGRPFDDEIVEAIEACEAMLLIFSDRCNESDYIRREVTVAGETQKLIIPFRIENAQPRKGLRVRLVDLHWIDAFEDRDGAIEALIFAVETGDTMH